MRDLGNNLTIEEFSAENFSSVFIKRDILLLLTPWLMEPGVPMPHSQGLSNNSYLEPNQPNSPH